MMNEKTRPSRQPKWLSSGVCLAQPTAVNLEKGIIEGVSLCTVGEAKGHGVHLDDEFIGDLVDQAAGMKQGLKCRFGHPNMCSTALGTFLGRIKNHRQVNGKAVGDLYLSNEAKEAPGHGDLHSYVLGMAKNEPDMFGMSIVFTPGGYYKRDSKGNRVLPPDWDADEESRGKQQDLWDLADPAIYVELDKLHASDAVDDPAANDDGLFSRFSRETMAGQVTEFLDLHPQVWKALEGSDDVLEALANYPDKVAEFFDRYAQYRGKKEPTKKEIEMLKLFQSKQALVEEEATADDASGLVEEEATADDASGLVEEESDSLAEQTKGDDALVDAAANEGQQAALQEKSAETDDRCESSSDAVDKEASADARAEGEENQKQEANEVRREFQNMVESFGAEVAATVFSAGGSYDDALALHAQNLADENEALKTKLILGGLDGDSGVAFDDTSKPDLKPLFKSKR